MSTCFKIWSREELLSRLKDRRLRAACEGDPKWNQFYDEWSHQAEENNRLEEEIEKLKKLKAESKQVKILEQVARSMMWMALNQRRQREHELEKSQLEDDLKVATSLQERRWIQQRLWKVDGKIQSSKSEVQFWEGQANRAGEESTIKEEGTTGKDNMSGRLIVWNREYLLSGLDHRLRAACEGDPKWNQFVDEGNCQAEENNRLLEEIKELKETNAESKQVKIFELRRQVANSKSEVASKQRWQREHELEKSQLKDDQKVATSFWERERIQQRLKEVDRTIQSCKSEVHYWEGAANRDGEELKQLESTIKEEEEAQNKKLLEEGLKEGSVKMRYIVCIIIGLPGVGKTCLKFLLMGLPPPELRSSTICAETPIRIEVQVRAISDIKLRASGERWVEVDNEGMLEIVAQMIILASEQHPQSKRFQFQKISDELTREAGLPQQGGEAESCGEVEVKKVAKENPLSRFVRWVKTRSRKRTHQQLEYSHGANLPVVALAPQPTVPSETYQTAVSDIMDKLVKIITTLRNKKPREASSIQATTNLLESIWVYLSDCGGQPQYHELLPLFIQHISAALCVLRLPDQLDKVQAVEYYSENQLLGVAQQSQLSAKDTIRCLVNTIQSFSTKGQKPSIILAGTHRDLLEEKAEQAASVTPAVGESSQLQGSSAASLPFESLEDKDQQLREMLEPEFSDQLVYHSKDMKQLLIPLNTLNPEETDKARATVVRKAVENSPAQEVEVPIWWYIFELLLQELAKRLGRKVLSKAECLEIANTLGFKEKALEAALVFFDKLNVIKYSPKVLPNIVFADSQVPLDKVSELVRESYLLRGDLPMEQSSSNSTPGEGKWRHFRDHGVLSPELMKKFPSHYVPGIFTIDDLSELLKESLVFAPIPTPDWAKPPPDSPPTSSATTSSPPPADSPSASPPQDSEPHFVMPASLVTLSDAELKKHRTSSTAVATLLVKFPQASRRAGVFCCFAVHLVRYCGWKLLLDTKEPLYRNCIKFHLMVSPPCTVTVIDSNSFIEVHADVSLQATLDECARLLPILKGSIFAGITAACRALKYTHTYPEIGFVCPHSEAGSPDASLQSELHSASITSDELFWCCDVDTKISGRLENCHHIWFGKVLDNSASSASLYATSQPPSSEASGSCTSTSVGLSLPTQSISAQTTSSTPHLPHIPEYISISSGAAKDTVSSSTPSGRPPTQSAAVRSTTQSTTDHSASNPPAPCVPEDVSSMSTEEINQMAKPTSTNMTLIIWRDEKGEEKQFRLKLSIMHRWRDVGDLVVPRQLLDVWANEKDAKARCTAVLCHWLDHPPRHYPATWEGLYKLLDHSELGQVATELKQAVDNAV